MRVGVDAGEGRGDAAAAGCGFQAFSPDAGLPHPLLVGVPAGETPGDVELRDEQVTGKFLSIKVNFRMDLIYVKVVANIFTSVIQIVVHNRN